MSKTKPILFDKVKPLYATYAPHVPFVIDNDTVEAAIGLLDNRALDLPRLATPPFEWTWLEFTASPDRGAHYLSTGVSIHRIGETLWTMRLYDWQHDIQTVYGSPFQVLICVDGHVRSGFMPPKMTDGDKIVLDAFVPEIEHEMQRYATIMLDESQEDPGTPIPAWVDKRLAVVFPYTPPNEQQELLEEGQAFFTQRRGLPAIMLAVLSLINHAPTSQRVLAPTGRWIDRQHGLRTRPFVVHTVVRIETTPKLARQAVERAHHALSNRAPVREHDVRGHPRRIRKGRADEYVVYVKPFKRGDANVGRVVHDAYETVRIDRENI